MHKSSPKVLLVVCLLLFQSLIPIASQGQGARVRQGSRPAGNGAELDQDAAETRGSDRDNPQGREEWFRSGRHAAGEHASDLLHRAYAQKRQMTVNSTGGSGSSATSLSTTNPGGNTASGIPFSGATYPGTWTNLGPAPISSDPGQDYGKVVGRVTSVAVDQGDTTGNTIYIGAAFGGVWKSINAAASDPTTVNWTPLIDDQPTLAVGAVSVQPGTTGNTAVVLVGTGEPNSSGDSYYGMGILRSSSGGAAGSWNLIKSADSGAKTFAGLGASKFAWSTNPSQPGLVVVGLGSTNGKRYGSDSVGGRGIYYSPDAGQTWHYATVQDPGGATLTEGTVTDVAYNPGTGRFYAFYRYHGLYESADGVNWTRSVQPEATPGTQLTITNCPTSQPTPNPTGKCPLYRGQIAIQPKTNDVYVIYVSDSDINQGVFLAGIANGAVASWQQLSSQGSTMSPVGAKVATSPLVDTVNTNAIVQGDYNLWMSAVPNGAGTDLMVGTRNVYKCSLGGSVTDCTSWLDLTHVYTCSPIAAPSHVHPDQHGSDFNRSNPLQMYFVNDGGVYRTLNGTSVSTGACTSPNPFDNLDANIGSLSEMVSFSQHPTNQNVLLGGLQDNGTPALLGSATLLWQTVNGGDGGFNEIDPNNPDGIWYATNTGVSIQQCDATNKQAPPNGPNIANAEACTPGTFGAAPYPAAGPNVGPSQVANDTAEFYMPYILDPANTSDLIVGTCRLWRGPGVGGSTWIDATAGANKDVSPIFDNTKTTCASGTTKIRAIAAGGPAPSGTSQVVYVGLEGAGTVSDSGSLLGHVFVNTQADVNTGTHGATNSWTDVTPNPGATLTTPGGTYGPYPVSSVEVDHHDVTGKTAYVTVEGFGVPHVFKTTSAGFPWSDVTSNLPDAPVDSIAVDPDDPNVLYLGTDVGAFISLNAGTSWQILGTGLPNVPVTKIRVFGSNAVQPKLLRVSTYGRGVWQFALAPPPPADLSPSPLDFGSVGLNLSIMKSATLTNNTNAGISITSASLTTGTDFSLANNNCASLAAFSSCQIQIKFTPHAAGTITDTLRVIDTASNSPQTLPLTGVGGVSNLSFTPSSLSFVGSPNNRTNEQNSSLFNGGTFATTITGISITGPFVREGSCIVGLSLGPGANCGSGIAFVPTAVGNFSGGITITDITGGTQTLPLTGTSVPPVSVSPTSLSFTGSVQNATQPQVLTVTNGAAGISSLMFANFSGPFSQSGGTCVPGFSGSTCTIPVVFTAVAAGPATGSILIRDSTNATLSVALSGTGNDFAIAAGTNGTSQTVNAGQPATYNLSASSVNGFNGNVSFACTTGVPAAATCTFSPSASVSVSGTTPTVVTLTISTTAHSSSQPAPTSGFMNSTFSPHGPAAMLTISLGALLTLLLAHWKSVSRKPRRIALVGMIAGVTLVPACGGGGGGTSVNPPPVTGTPAGTYTVTVAATSGNRSIPTTLTLKVN